MFAKLKNLKNRFDALDREMADPTVASDPKRLQEAAREQAEIREVVASCSIFADGLRETI